MNSNPYSAPEVDLELEHNDNPLYVMDRKALNKLYYRSCNVQSITAIWIIGVAFSAMIMFSVNLHWLTLLVSIFYTLAIVGTFQRSHWGRIVGILASALMLIWIPLGTVLGLAGLFAFIGAPELFGDDRITHKELKAVFKDRKKRKI